MSDIESNSQESPPFFIASQPILDADQAVWGYEVHFSKCDSTQSPEPDPEAVTPNMFLEGFSLAQSPLNPEARIVISFPRQSLLKAVPSLLPKDQLLLQVTTEIILDKPALKQVIELKRQGYQVVMAGYTGKAQHQAVYQLVDTFRTDVRGMDLEALQRIVQTARDNSCAIMADHVENKDLFELTRQAGFDLFQGDFFSQPETIPGKALPSNQLAKIQLLDMLHQEESFDPKKLSEIIQTDLSLSYKLLRYINSPAIGLRNEVTSIQHAINLLGYQKIVNWFRVLIMGDLNPSNKGQELTMRSVLRGRFLQVLAQGVQSPFDAEGMFLLGLFSQLDAVMDRSMEDIVAELPLEDKLAATLQGEQTDATPWLDLVEAQEQADWSRLTALISELNLVPEYTANCYVQAMQWASELTGAE
jgi:EAL and modified HD-GYP domain-containing signal transduction protein